MQCKNEEEIVAVIAHELGHWKLNHTMFTFIAVQVCCKFLKCLAASPLPSSRLPVKTLEFVICYTPWIKDLLFLFFWMLNRKSYFFIFFIFVIRRPMLVPVRPWAAILLLLEIAVMFPQLKHLSAALHFAPNTGYLILNLTFNSESLWVFWEFN